MTCKNCNSEVNLNYCPQCGRPTKLHRIDGHYIQHEIEHLLHFERGFLYTIKELFLRPGQSIKHFIDDDRNRLVKPIVFVIVCALINTFVTKIFDIEVGFIHIDTKLTAMGAIFNWLENHYGYANLFYGIFMAGYAKFLFKTYKYNFFEILVLMCYVLGMQMLIITFFLAIAFATKIELMPFALILMMIYNVWSISQFFDKTKVMNYLKALISHLAGFITANVLLGLVGIIIEEIKRH